MNTITAHMESLIKDGRDLDIDRLVSPSKRDEISRRFLTLKSFMLTPVVDHFKGSVSYEEARIVRACLQRQAD